MGASGGTHHTQTPGTEACNDVCDSDITGWHRHIREICRFMVSGAYLRFPILLIIFSRVFHFPKPAVIYDIFSLSLGSEQ